MAKPTKHAPIICIALAIFAVIGIILSLFLYSPLPIIIFLIPTVLYEIYRTEGPSTKTASILIGVVLLMEMFLIIFKIDFDLVELLGQDSKYIAGYDVPLGALTIVGPIIITILSVILFTRTRGIYTRALAVIIFVSCFIIIYEINPNSLKDLFKFATEEAIDRLSYI